MGSEKTHEVEHEEKSPRGIDRERMRPLDYLSKYTENLPQNKKIEVYKRKIKIVSKISSAISGNASLNNEQLDVVIAGEVSPDVLADWVREARLNKDRCKPVGQSIKNISSNSRGNYNAGIVSEILDRKMDGD